jgi:hypothetical protein
VFFVSSTSARLTRTPTGPKLVPREAPQMAFAELDGLTPGPVAPVGGRRLAVNALSKR